jgi:hypothetical protein
MTEENPTPQAEPSAEVQASPSKIVATPSTWYRGKWLVMCLALIGWGVWSLHDGYYKYPSENNADVAAHRTPRHPTYDIPGNIILGWTLPPLGLAGLIWTMRRSRGVYELDGETLSIPGHPPIPLSSIQTVDRQKWDRKGIAIVEYNTGEKTGKFKLDDFIYERDPTDEIFKRIEIAVTSPA